MFYIFLISQYIRTVLTFILKHQSYGSKVGAKVKTDMNILEYVSGSIGLNIL